MAEKLPTKDASPTISSKAAGNPALRMMGRSIVGEISERRRLINKTYRTAKFQIQATLSQLAYFLDDNWLLRFDAAV